MGKRNPDVEWERKWGERSIIDSSVPAQSNGTKPVIISDWRYEVLINSLPSDKQGLFKDFIHSISNPKP